MYIIILLTKKPLHGGFFVWYNGDMIKTSKDFPVVDRRDARPETSAQSASRRLTTGFTVLEFLIVITIIGILIAIVLVSLEASRARSRDDQRIARVQNVSVALEQFYTDCRTYPLELTVGYICPTNSNITLGNYISDLENWDGTNPEYFYQPLSYGGNIEPCTGYHIGVQFENTGNSFAARDAQFNSNNADTCTTDGVGFSSISSPFDGTISGLYDLKR